MRHIAETYGQKNNLLELTQEEYEQLEPFLLALGVRSRTTMMYQGTITIQAENVYKNAWLNDTARKVAERQLTKDAISAYKR